MTSALHLPFLLPGGPACWAMLAALILAPVLGPAAPPATAPSALETTAAPQAPAPQSPASVLYSFQPPGGEGRALPAGRPGRSGESPRGGLGGGGGGRPNRRPYDFLSAKDQRTTDLLARFRENLMADLESIPALRDNFRQMADLQQQRAAIVRRRAEFARNPEIPSDKTYRQFHDLVKLDEDLSRHQSELVAQLLQQAPTLIDALRARAASTEAELAQLEAALTDSPGPGSLDDGQGLSTADRLALTAQSGQLAARLRRYTFLAEKLQRVSENPRRAELLRRIITSLSAAPGMGLPFPPPDLAELFGTSADAAPVPGGPASGLPPLASTEPPRRGPGPDFQPGGPDAPAADGGTANSGSGGSSNADRVRARIRDLERREAELRIRLEKAESTIDQLRDALVSMGLRQAMEADGEPLLP